MLKFIIMLSLSFSNAVLKIQSTEYTPLHSAQVLLRSITTKDQFAFDEKFCQSLCESSYGNHTKFGLIITECIKILETIKIKDRIYSAGEFLSNFDSELQNKVNNYFSLIKELTDTKQITQLNQKANQVLTFLNAIENTYNDPRQTELLKLITETLEAYEKYSILGTHAEQNFQAIILQHFNAINSETPNLQALLNKSKQELLALANTPKETITEDIVEICDATCCCCCFTACCHINVDTTPEMPKILYKTSEDIYMYSQQSSKNLSQQSSHLTKNEKDLISLSDLIRTLAHSLELFQFNQEKHLSKGSTCSYIIKTSGKWVYDKTMDYTGRINFWYMLLATVVVIIYMFNDL